MRAVTTRKTIDSAQFNPLFLSRNRLKKSCHRSSTQDTAVYRKLSTKLLLLGGAVRGPRHVNRRVAAGWGNDWRNGVVPAGVERVAAQQAAQRQPAAPAQAEALDRRGRVGAARRRVPARGRQRRADESPI